MGSERLVDKLLSQEIRVLEEELQWIQSRLETEEKVKRALENQRKSVARMEDKFRACQQQLLEAVECCRVLAATMEDGDEEKALCLQEIREEDAKAQAMKRDSDAKVLCEQKKIDQKEEEFVKWKRELEVKRAWVTDRLTRLRAQQENPDALLPTPSSSSLPEEKKTGEEEILLKARQIHLVYEEHKLCVDKKTAVVKKLALIPTSRQQINEAEAFTRRMMTTKQAERENLVLSLEAVEARRTAVLTDNFFKEGVSEEMKAQVRAETSADAIRLEQKYKQKLQEIDQGIRENQETLETCSRQMRLQLEKEADLQVELDTLNARLSGLVIQFQKRFE